MKLPPLAHLIQRAAGLGPDDDLRSEERRREPRREVHGHQILVRQRKAVGIMHLKNLSSGGGCGMTDMPLAVGSLVFLQFRKPHFFAAEVRWVRCFTIGLQFFRPMRPAMIERLRAEPAGTAWDSADPDMK